MYDLRQKLISLETTDLLQDSSEEKKEIRVWMDGAFDMMHFGHMNAFRQGRSLGTYLIAGVNSDETITACKGPPVCNEAERVDTVRGCKWVDEVVEGVPYVMNDEYLTYIIDKYKIDYIVHGDDPCIVDGKNVYESAIRLGNRFPSKHLPSDCLVCREIPYNSSHRRRLNNRYRGENVAHESGTSPILQRQQQRRQPARQKHSRTSNTTQFIRSQI